MAPLYSVYEVQIATKMSVMPTEVMFVGTGTSKLNVGSYGGA